MLINFSTKVACYICCPYCCKVDTNKNIDLRRTSAQAFTSLQQPTFRNCQHLSQAYKAIPNGVFSRSTHNGHSLRGIIERAASVGISIHFGLFQGFTENLIWITKEEAYLNDVIILESEEQLKDFRNSYLLKILIFDIISKVFSYTSSYYLILSRNRMR